MDEHAVFTKLNEAYCAGAKSDDFKYVIIIIIRHTCNSYLSCRMQQLTVYVYGQIGRYGNVICHVHGRL